jgi:hypothetical protein
MGVERFKDHFVPRLAGVAGLHGVGRVVLPADARLPEGGGVWAVVADQAGCGIGSGQYRGGTRTGEYTDICSIPAHRSRVAERVGDAFTACGEGRDRKQNAHRCADGAMRDLRKDAPGTHSLAATKSWRTLMRSKRIANRGWRIGISVAIRYSRFAICAPILLLAPIRYSLFAIRYSP